MKNHFPHFEKGLSHYGRVGAIVMGFIALAAFMQMGLMSMNAQAQTVEPRPLSITGHTLYNQLATTQTFTVEGTNIRNGDWDLGSCLVDGEFAPEDSVYVGVYSPIGSGPIFIPAIQIVGLADFVGMDGANEQFRFTAPAFSNFRTGDFTRFYLSKCNTAVIGSHWVASDPFLAPDDDLKIANILTVDEPSLNDLLAVGKPATVISHIYTGTIPGAGSQVRIEYYLNPIPKPGESISSNLKKMYETANFAPAVQDHSSTWARAGFYNSVSEPFIGDATITARLVTSAGALIATSRPSAQFEIGKQMNIMVPAEEPINYFWKGQNESITIEYKGDATLLKGTLLKGSTSNNPFIPIPLFTNCAVVNHQATCEFDLPTKPAGAIDGPGYLILVEEVNSEFGTPVSDSLTVIMNSVIPTEDFSFDTDKGVRGFVFNPLVFGPADKPDVEVGVWVKYESTDNKPSSKAVTLNVHAAFDEDLDDLDFSDLDLLVPAGIESGTSVYVPFGKAQGDSYHWAFKMLVDSSSLVDETNENNNAYFGEDTSVGNPTIDLEKYGTLVYFGATDNPANSYIRVPLGQKGGMIVQLVNHVGYNLPAGHKVLSGRMTFNYDETALSIAAEDIVSEHEGFTISFNPTLSSPGELAVDISLDPDNYPLTPRFTINWLTILPGEHDITLSWTKQGDTSDETNLYLTNDNTPGEYGDTLRGTNVGNFTVEAQGVIKPVSGTYYSRKYPVSNDEQRWSSWANFRAVYNDQLSTQGLTTDTKFALGFFNAAGQNLCSSASCATGFDGAGYYLVPVDKSYNPSDGTSGEVNISNLNSITWMSQVASVQIRITMASSNYYGAESAQPWVESVAINYQSDLLGEVGLISGNTIINIQRGGTATYSFVIARLEGSTFSGQVNWAISESPDSPEVAVLPATGSVTIDDANPTRTIPVTFSATQDAVLNVPYPFTISATSSDAQKVFRPLSVGLTVQGDNSAPFDLIVTPMSASVGQGGSTTFSVTADRDQGFTNAITLSDNILAVFGNDVTNVTYNPSDRVIDANTNGPVTITLTAATEGTDDSARMFTVTGNSGADQSGKSVQVTITDGSNLKNVTIQLTAPIEGGNNSSQPVFSFRLYSAANTQVFEKTDIRTNGQDQASVNVNGLGIGGTYRGFIRSTRHLWREATSPIAVSATQDSYNMSFTKLLAGDIDNVGSANFINSLDAARFTVDWHKNGQEILADFNGDGFVNVLDFASIIVNWFKTGSALPN